MKKDIAGFVDKCLNCQQVIAEYQKLEGLLQDIDLQVGGGEYGLRCKVVSYS